MKAITPSEAFSKSICISKEVERINAFLSKPWSDYEKLIGRWFSAEGLSSVQVSAIRGFYENVGWDVKFVDDQRDGASLHFSAR